MCKVDFVEEEGDFFEGVEEVVFHKGVEGCLKFNIKRECSNL